MNGIEANVYGLRMLYDADYAAADWKHRPDFEPFMRSILQRHKGLFIDAGCNAGFHTLSAASLGLDVIAVDANYLNAALLQKTVILNGLTNRVTVIPAALGIKGGVTTVDVAPSNSSIDHGGLPVVMLTLDYVVSKYGMDRQVSMIKIDVEGHEEFVISGGIKTIEKYSPTLVIEHSPLIVGDNRNVFNIIKEIGYTCKVVGKNDLPFDGDVSQDPNNVFMYECKKI